MKKIPTRKNYEEVFEHHKKYRPITYIVEGGYLNIFNGSCPNFSKKPPTFRGRVGRVVRHDALGVHGVGHLEKGGAACFATLNPIKIRF